MTKEAVKKPDADKKCNQKKQNPRKIERVEIIPTDTLFYWR